jgi:Abnormal spindle-like microcephaly-assoc'd, ASPM-SPD-2-Hydin
LDLGAAYSLYPRSSGLLDQEDFAKKEAIERLRKLMRVFHHMDIRTCHGRHSQIASPVRHFNQWRFLVSLLIALFFSFGIRFPNPAAQQNIAHAASSNPIVVENQQPGTTSWQFDNFNKESRHEIEGYTSLTSVNKGSQISFMVSLSTNAQYTMDIYRMGYYSHGTNPDGSACSGCGGRLMQSVGPLNGTTQAACPTTTSGADFGMIECQWTTSYTLTIPTSWTTGNYIVKLKRLDDQLENYLTFVVRDDSSTADIVYSMDVTTWQAYSYWGGTGNKNIGYNLYGKFNDVSQAFIGNTRAYTVSFDRPYMDQGSEDGAGNFMVWDYPMIHWMEAQGYNITYVTDVDLENNPGVFRGHKVFVNTGHDEYYSDNMRANVQNFINSGGNAAFFSANDINRRMTWNNSISGQPDRREHCDKGALAGSTTIDWRELTPPQPENQIIGSLSNGAAAARPFLVYDAKNWIFAGTGLVNYNGTVITSGPGQNAIAGLIGYEFSTRTVNDHSLSAYASYDPPDIQQVGHSFVPASDNGVNSWADTTLYTSSGGGIVFSAGTIEWSWGVDNGFNDGFCDCDQGFANTDSQIITANILSRLVGNSAPAVSLSPTALSFGNQNVGTTSAVQTVTLTNTGTSALTINSIALTGTNTNDFAQTNTCPVSPATLATSTSCTLSVTFTPSTNGANSASLSISDNAAGSPQTISLLGTGVTSAPVATLNPTSVNFDNQNVGTSSSTQAVTLTNTGTIPLTITSITLTGTNASDFAQTNTCPVSPGTLAVNGSCTLNVTFTPATTGARNASISISDNAAGSPQIVPLSGIGVTPAPTVTLNPTSVNFGNQNVSTTSTAQSVTLTNTGTLALTVTSITLTGTNASDFAETSTCPMSPNTLAANTTCKISILFTPGATGSRGASVNISDNAPDSPQSVTLGGTGVTHTPGVSLIGSTTANGNFGAGVSLQIPSVQAGDLLIAVAGTNGSPSSWTTPTGWNVGASSVPPDDQGLNWWWKIASGSESGTTLTLKSSSYADGGGVALAYRGASATPIEAVSALATNDNNSNGNVTSAQFNRVSWSASASVVNLLLMSWQPVNATVTWPTGYALQATANDSYSYVTVGANLTSQTVSSLSAQTATLSGSEAVVPTLQIAILAGP